MLDTMFRQIDVSKFEGPVQGWEARAGVAISKGEVVCIYAGEVIARSEAARRLVDYDARGIGHALLVRSLKASMDLVHKHGTGSILYRPAMPSVDNSQNKPAKAPLLLPLHLEASCLARFCMPALSNLLDRCAFAVAAPLQSQRLGCRSAFALAVCFS